MAKSNRFDDYDYDSYGRGGIEKIKHSKKSKHKGHQSRKSECDYWLDILNKQDDSSLPESPVANATYHPTSTPAPQPSQYVHQFGPNTREIKGVKIDMDGVANIEKIENTKNGILTYGIKFIFSGNKGLYRIIWFNQNLKLRDIIFGQEYSFWKSLQAKTNK